MGRIALFVIFVGGLSYLILQHVVNRLIGLRLSPLASASASIIVAVIAWTALIWIAGERLGRGPAARTEDERSRRRPPDDMWPKEE